MLGEVERRGTSHFSSFLRGQNAYGFARNKQSLNDHIVLCIWFPAQVTPAVCAEYFHASWEPFPKFSVEMEAWGEALTTARWLDLCLLCRPTI